MVQNCGATPVEVEQGGPRKPPGVEAARPRAWQELGGSEVAEPRRRRGCRAAEWCGRGELGFGGGAGGDGMQGGRGALLIGRRGT